MRLGYATANDTRGLLPFITLPFLPEKIDAHGVNVTVSSSAPFLMQYMGCVKDEAAACPAHRWVVCTLGCLLVVMGLRVWCLWWGTPPLVF